jgi:hypothetical protein
MADVRLAREEEKGALPSVCMCCGEPATAHVDQTFMLNPPVVQGPSGFAEIHAIRVLLAAADAPRLDLRTTFCDQHRHYWLIRNAVLFGGIAGLFAALFFGFATVAYLFGVRKIDAPWLSCCVIVPVLLVVIPWAIAVNYFGKTMIRARLMGDDSVMLQNVGERYAAAVEASRQPRTPPPPPPMPAPRG